MQDLSKISVVLPSLDPDEKLVAVIDGLLEYGFTDIILVNDGSKQENLHYFLEQADKHPEIHLIHHEVNRGKGAALKTAFTWFLQNRPEGYGIVTVDGDNQHHPEDTRRCCEHMMETGRVVLGCRDFTLPHVPSRSRFGNHTTSAIFKIFVGMTISDTQTGLRAIPRPALETLNQVYGDRFEYETNMLLAMKEKGIAFDEVKIRTVYIEENKSSHFRVIHDSWRIYKLILKHFFRYTVSSLASAVVDTLGYSLLNWVFSGCLSGLALTASATVIARVCSSLMNFFVNQKLVFQTDVPTGKAMGRYFMLAIPQLIVQVLLTEGTFRLLSIPESAYVLRTLIYVCVMTVLFVMSYMIQQRWVFAPTTENREVEKNEQKNPNPSQSDVAVKPPKKKGKLIWRIIRRFFLLLFTLIFLLVGGLAVILNLVFNGPSTAARDVLTMSLLEPSGTKWIPGLFMSEETINEIRASANAELPADVSDASQVVINKDGISGNSDEWANYPDGIYIESYAGDTYNAHIMVIRDPSSVYLSCANGGSFSRSKPGARITDQLQSEGAIAAINAGAFYDDASSSLEVGSTPEGLVLSGGAVKWTHGAPPKGAGGFVGFNNDDILVVAESMTASKAEELGIRDGCEFGPVLIMNGQINEGVYNSNSGYNPRTCIGQRADGAVIFLCIDGRQAGSVGATYRDCIDILWEYGCVNACNLDGGSSSIMLYRDAYGLYGEAGQVQMINNYSLLQENPRRMPTFWMVRPSNEEG